MATVFEQVREIIVNQLSVPAEDVVPSANLQEDLGADSLDAVELIMSFEEHFSTNGTNLKIEDAEAEKIVVVQDILDVLQSKGVDD